MLCCRSEHDAHNTASAPPAAGVSGGAHHKHRVPTPRTQYQQGTGTGTGHDQVSIAYLCDRDDDDKQTSVSRVTARTTDYYCVCVFFFIPCGDSCLTN